MVDDLVGIPEVILPSSTMAVPHDVQRPPLLQSPQLRLLLQQLPLQRDVLHFLEQSSKF